MSALSVAERAVGAVVGSLIADAAALPLHWIYDVQVLDKAVDGRSDPEFLPEPHCPFYHIATGRNSCYGHQAYVLLESLAECKGFDKTDYKKRLYEAFGPKSEYEGNLGRPHTREDLPVSYPWRNGSLRTFIANYEAGKEETGADDSQADGHAKVAPLVALYAGRPELESLVREAVAVTQNNELAIGASVTAAKILEKYILTGTSADVLPSVQKEAPGEFSAHIAEALEIKDTDHRAAVKQFGSSCALPGSFKSAIHCIANPEEYIPTVRRDMVAGGDNCSRLCLIGAIRGAQVGIGQVPAEWIAKTDVGAKAKQLAEKLVACRPT